MTKIGKCDYHLCRKKTELHECKYCHNFFCKELSQYLTSDLNPLGRKIIECCLEKGDLKDYEKLIPAKY